jgi:uncharacterized protein (DUF2384 family)
MNTPQPPELQTISENDYLQLFKNEVLDAKKVIELLQYKKEDISVAANVPLDSVRYDQKMPSELKERITEWAGVLNLVASFFKDEEKTVLWFCTPNPLLGGMSPRDMIRVGRFNKLLNFIQSLLNENQR